jgi:hypothetical protein
MTVFWCHSERSEESNWTFVAGAAEELLLDSSLRPE